MSSAFIPDKGRPGSWLRSWHSTGVAKTLPPFKLDLFTVLTASTLLVL